MSITAIQRDLTLTPCIVRVESSNTLAEVAAADYLTAQAANIEALNSGVFDWMVGDIVAVAASDGSEFFRFDGDDFTTLIQMPGGNGEVTLPVVSGDFTVFDGTLGALKDLGYLPSDAAKTRVVMAGSAVVANHIAKFVDTTGTVDDTAGAAINSGNIQAGLSGTAGTLGSFPSAATSGELLVAAVTNSSGNFNTTVSNAAAVGQSQVVSIPDSGAATANFLLDTGAANIIAQQHFVGLSDVLTFGTGTWTVTRIAQGNYVSRHTAADETSIIAVDITPIIRATAAKGFRLDSFDYIYSIGTLAMDAHSLTLDRIAYANNVAVSVTSITGTYTLSTATQANPYVTNCTVTTPAFDVTADSKYVIEISANNAATTAFDYYGIVLRFSQTIG